MFDPEILEPEVGGILDDVVKVVSPVVDSARDAAVSRGGTAVDELLRSTEFRRVINEVEVAAKRAVTEEVQTNALALGGIAFSAGIVGGILFKDRRTGLLVAGALAAIGIFTITRRPAPRR